MRGMTLAAIGLTALIGCTADVSEPDVVTYDEFKARAYQEPDTGIFIINGDEPVLNEEGMQAAYESYLQSVAHAKLREQGLATASQELIINRVNGRKDKWDPQTAANLTYCISSASFGAQYNNVVNAMNVAASAWESATFGRVNFIHAAWLDGNCTTATGVVFNVRGRDTSDYAARAFFPAEPRPAREVIIAYRTLGGQPPFSLAGILRHELGHALGFRHEHTRPGGAARCFEDYNWRELTPYDRASVMHYPSCGGTQTGDLVLTGFDVSGVRSVY